MSTPERPVPTDEALARYRALSEIWSLEHQGQPLRAAVSLVAERAHVGADGRLSAVSRRTLYRWLKAFAEHGLMGLEPKQRQRLKGSVALRDDLLDFLIAEHELDPSASIPELIRRARQLGRARADESVHRTTVHRTFVRLGLPTRASARAPIPDARRFAYKERLQMVLTDGKHFRAGAGRHRRVAVYLLDDATRFGLDVIVASSENTKDFLLLLHRALLHHGLFDALYCDHGSAFAGGDTTAVLANIAIPHILGTVGYPQGRGKIERFNRSVDERLLRSLDGAPDVDSDCGALTLRLRHDLHEVYNHLPHESLGRETPYQRFMNSTRRTRCIPDDAWLIKAFSIPFTRKVSRDHVVSVDGTAFEMPRGYAGQTVTLYRRVLEDGHLYLHHQGQWFRLHPVDPYANALSPRGRPEAPQASPDPHPHPTASTLAFNHAHGSVLGPDGGFKEADPNPDNPDKE